MASSTISFVTSPVFETVTTFVSVFTVANLSIYFTESLSSPESTLYEYIAFIIPSIFGFTIGKSSPAYIACIRKFSVI